MAPSTPRLSVIHSVTVKLFSSRRVPPTEPPIQSHLPGLGHEVGLESQIQRRTTHLPPLAGSARLRIEIVVQPTRTGFVLVPSATTLFNRFEATRVVGCASQHFSLVCHGQLRLFPDRAFDPAPSMKLCICPAGCWEMPHVPAEGCLRGLDNDPCPDWSRFTFRSTTADLAI